MLGGVGLAERPHFALFGAAKISESAGYFRQWLAHAGVAFLNLEGRGECVESHRLTGEQYDAIYNHASRCAGEYAQPSQATTVTFFTGTRTGLTRQQKEAVRLLLVFRNVVAAYHGCCIGADEFFNTTVAGLREGTRNESLSLVIYGYPSDLGPDLTCSSIGLCNVIAVPDNPLKRNVRMAEVAAGLKIEYDRGSRVEPILIACPKEIAEPENGRGGTWHAVRNFLERGARVHVVWPSGEVQVWTA